MVSRLVTINAPPNKLLDVSGKQRLSYRVALQTLACVTAVSPHVTSTISLLHLSVF
jgi:hypothetical protein